ncbi:MAG: bifunctional serine/threonine-protein kinase/formylglycine-generating enzyme family protein, partial [Myxococcota bacterium]
YRAYDHALQAPVALKVLAPALAADPSSARRFEAEAQATAQLQHPGIVPVHRFGHADDGRPFFTMKIVQGRTLGAVFGDPDRTGAQLRARVELVRRAVEAVAYAHQRGVLHRDLKPSNVMVGAFGEVCVLDWGSSADDATGTPRYRAPEVRAGRPARTTSDVYALGLVLWDAVHVAPGASDVHPVTRARESGEALPWDGDLDLRAVVDEATTLDADARTPSGAELATALERWLDGAARRARGEASVARAAELRDERARCAERAAELRAEADRLLAEVRPSDPVAAKLPGWRAQDAASELEIEVRRLEQDQLRTLQGALTHAPDLPAALAALAAHHREGMERAEARGDVLTARERAADLRHYDRGDHREWLQGDGRLVLVTEPAGAEVVLYRYVEQDRVLVPVVERSLGPSPVEVALPMGRHLVELRADGHETVWYPVHLERCGTWRGPPVVLPPARSIGPDERYVPGGPFLAGAHDDTFQSWWWHQRELDSFVIARHPVTNAEYLGFLNALEADGRFAEAAAYAPRERGAQGQAGPQLYGRGPDGRFALVPDADGDLWDPRWPVVLIDAASAEAYAAWRERATGQPWRLPTEFELEKAARGVDGRAYPWGDRFDPTFCCVRDSHPGRPLLAPVDAYPTDCSVYGVRGLAGNVRQWCSSEYRAVSGGRLVPGATGRVLKGGCWFFPGRGSHGAARAALDATNRGDTVGFRLVRSWVSGR